MIFLIIWPDATGVFGVIPGLHLYQFLRVGQWHSKKTKKQTELTQYHTIQVSVHLKSCQWLQIIRRSRQCNITVSIHIRMCDMVSLEKVLYNPRGIGWNKQVDLAVCLDVQRWSRLPQDCLEFHTKYINKYISIYINDWTRTTPNSKMNGPPANGLT